MITPPVGSGLILPVGTRSSTTRLSGNSFKTQLNGLTAKPAALTAPGTQDSQAAATAAKQLAVVRPDTAKTAVSTAAATPAVNGRVDTQGALKLLMDKLRS